MRWKWKNRAYLTSQSLLHDTWLLSITKLKVCTHGRLRSVRAFERPEATGNTIGSPKAWSNVKQKVTKLYKAQNTLLFAALCGTIINYMARAGLRKTLASRKSIDLPTQLRTIRNATGSPTQNRENTNINTRPSDTDAIIHTHRHALV